MAQLSKCLRSQNKGIYEIQFTVFGKELRLEENFSLDPHPPGAALEVVGIGARLQKRLVVVWDGGNRNLTGLLHSRHYEVKAFSDRTQALGFLLSLPNGLAPHAIVMPEDIALGHRTEFLCELRRLLPAAFLRVPVLILRLAGGSATIVPWKLRNESRLIAKEAHAALPH